MQKLTQVVIGFGVAFLIGSVVCYTLGSHDAFRVSPRPGDADPIIGGMYLLIAAIFCLVIGFYWHCADK